MVFFETLLGERRAQCRELLLSPKPPFEHYFNLLSMHLNSRRTSEANLSSGFDALPEGKVNKDEDTQRAEGQTRLDVSKAGG